MNKIKLRDSPYPKLAGRPLFSWAIGIWATIAYGGARGVSMSDLGHGAFIGALAGFLFWVVNRHRTERALT